MDETFELSICRSVILIINRIFPPADVLDQVRGGIIPYPANILNRKPGADRNALVSPETLDLYEQVALELEDWRQIVFMQATGLLETGHISPRCLLRAQFDMS